MNKDISALCGSRCVVASTPASAGGQIKWVIDESSRPYFATMRTRPRIGTKAHPDVEIIGSSGQEQSTTSTGPSR